MRLILIRHGESEYNLRLSRSLDSSLSKFGEQQVLQTAININHMKGPTQFAGHTSPYRRTLETAAIIQSQTGIPFKVMLGPREVMTIYDYCKIGNHSKDFPQFDWSNFTTDPEIEFQHEKDEEYLDRVEGYIQNELEEPGTIVVSHGMTVVTMMELAMGIRRVPSSYFYVDNASITHVVDGRLVCYNQR